MMMKKRIAIFATVARIYAACTMVYADTYDFPNMTVEELKEVKSFFDE